jgi:GDPmannose 4,6-dehydratase
MWLMLQRDEPDDFVIATGTTHSVRELCEVAFQCVDLNYEDFVTIDPAFIRPAEVDLLVGDSSKAHATLGWAAETDFRGLVEMMVVADIKALQH